MPSKNKSNEKKNKKKKFKYVPRSIRLGALFKSLRMNYLFYLSILLCALILRFDKQNTKSFGWIIASFTFIPLTGYVVHYVSHHVNINNHLFNSNSIIADTYGIKSILKLMADIMDFHAVIHHDTKINKKKINIFYEFVSNFIIQGLNVFFVIHFAKYLEYLDERICFIWGLAYATIHHINYNIIVPKIHMQHHINDKTNYGIDIYDIIFGTKFNWQDLENFNHFGINFIVITLLIVVIHRIFKRWIVLLKYGLKFVFNIFGTL